MLTMDDVKAMQRGKDAEVEEKSSDLAGRKIDEMIGQMEQGVQQEADAHAMERQEQGANGNGIEADAQEILSELQSNPEQADQMFSQLQPEMQKAIMSLMDSTAQQEETTESADNPQEETTEPVDENRAMAI